MLRLDLIHAEVSGNKWFKLKRNYQKALSQHQKTILTFGGAYSNHIAATAAFCADHQLTSIGIIRGEEPVQLNQTLTEAKRKGMHLYFVSREAYDRKTETAFIEKLKTRFGDFYLVPEGGNNEEGLLGCMDILNPTWDYDYVFTACGTGTTAGGLMASARTNQHVIGISVLKGENVLPQDAMRLLKQTIPESTIQINGNEALDQKTIKGHSITNRYCFKGYAAYDKVLIAFKLKFEEENKIPLDYVYTNKLVYAVFDLIETKKLKRQSKILIIHSGGLQGNLGFTERYQRMPIL